MLVDTGFERGSLPVHMGPARHHIGVAGKGQHRAVVSMGGPEVFDIAEGESFDLEAEPL